MPHYGTLPISAEHVTLVPKLSQYFVIFNVILKYHLKNIHFSFFFLSRHPDKNSDPAAENRFVEINQAYEVRT
jgi:curved DNA-binding protein CbpA